MNDPEGTAPKKCVAKKQSGQPCVNWPIKGATVCRVHGGSAPQVKRKAQQRVALADWERHFGAPDTDGADPSATVLAEIAWAKGHLAWMRQMIGEGDETWIPRYGEWSDRLTRMCYLAHRMGIEERLTDAAESLGASLMALIERVLEDTPDSARPVVRESFMRNLRAIQPGT